MPAFFVEGPINTDDKDCHVRLMGKWIWEVSELGSTVRRADREALKFFISQQTVTIRKPYGRLDTVKPAMASLLGTVNNESGILADPTGNRRFLVCKVESIDWEYAKLSPAQVWAEAYQLYQDGEPWQLTPEEIKSMLDNKDIWLDAEEVAKRLEARLTTEQTPAEEPEKPKKTRKKTVNQ